MSGLRSFWAEKRVPTDLSTVVCLTLKTMLIRNLEIALEKNLCQEFRVIDGESEEGDVITLNDVPLQFGEFKSTKIEG